MMILRKHKNTKFCFLKHFEYYCKCRDKINYGKFEI